MDTFGKVATKSRGPIELLLIVLILIDYAPIELLGPNLSLKVRQMMGPFLDPVKSMMNHLFVRAFLWFLLLWACCKSKDMNMFFLIVVFFIVSNK